MICNRLPFQLQECEKQLISALMLPVTTQGRTLALPMTCEGREIKIGNL